MGLKYRSGRTYYYKSIRVDGRVVSRYAGHGESAVLMARMNSLIRDQERARREEIQVICDRLKSQELPAIAMFTHIETIFIAAMHAAGFHRHDRGQWRRTLTNPSNPRPPAKVRKRRPKPIGPEEKARLLQRANQGDLRMEKKAAQLVAEQRGWALSVVGDPGLHARNALIERWAGDNLIVREALSAKFSALASEVAGANAGPVERLLAERVAFSWFAVHEAEQAYYHFEHQTLAQVELQQRLIDRAHRRLLSAIRSLAVFRQLAVPQLTAVIQQSVAMVSSSFEPGVSELPSLNSPKGGAHDSARNTPTP